MRAKKLRRDEKMRRSNATNRGSSAKKNSIDLTDLDPVNADLPVNSDFQPEQNTGQIPKKNSENRTVVIEPKESEVGPTLVIRQPSLSGGNGAACCRICLAEEQEDDNPLFSPCKCSGTMSYVHL